MVGWYAFIAFTIAAFAQLVVGYLGQAFDSGVFAVVALLQAVFFYFMIHLEGVAALLVAIAFMLAVFGQIPITTCWLAVLPKCAAQPSLCASHIVTFSVSATAVPIIAWIHSTWGFGTLFSVLAVAALIIFVATLFLPGRETQAQTATA